MSAISSIAYDEVDDILFTGDERGYIYAYNFKSIAASDCNNIVFDLLNIK